MAVHLAEVDRFRPLAGGKNSLTVHRGLLQFSRHIGHFTPPANATSRENGTVPLVSSGENDLPRRPVNGYEENPEGSLVVPVRSVGVGRRAAHHEVHDRRGVLQRMRMVAHARLVDDRDLAAQLLVACFQDGGILRDRDDVVGVAHHV